MDTELSVNWIRYHRMKFDLTQKELADKIGVSKTTIKRWERGETEPKLSKVKELNKVFKIRRKV